MYYLKQKWNLLEDTGKFKEPKAIWEDLASEREKLFFSFFFFLATLPHVELLGQQSDQS